MKLEHYNFGHNKLILFFNGLAMDFRPLKRFTLENADLLHVFHYTDLKQKERLRTIMGYYREIYMIGFSLGAFFASRLALHPENLAGSMMINGVEDNFFSGLNKLNITRFMQDFHKQRLNFFYKTSAGKYAMDFSQNKPDRSAADVCKEINFLYSLKDIPSSHLFQNAIVSLNDQILSPDFQIASHQKNRIPFHAIHDEPHFIFPAWSSFKEILSMPVHI